MSKKKLKQKKPEKIKKIQQLTAYLETEVRKAKTILDAGCCGHNSVVEEAIAKANFDTLTKVLEKAKSTQLPF